VRLRLLEKKSNSFYLQCIKKFSMVENLINLLKKEGLEVTLFGEVRPNPMDEMVHNAVNQMKNDKPEVIVCIGSGIPIDATRYEF
jgi:alcohol dehydrogenase class IV